MTKGNDGNSPNYSYRRSVCPSARYVESPLNFSTQTTYNKSKERQSLVYSTLNSVREDNKNKSDGLFSLLRISVNKRNSESSNKINECNNHIVNKINRFK